FAGLLLRRRRGPTLLWAIGFALFGVAATCEAVAQRSGWTPGLFRAYYLAGGVLTVAFLGAGSAWLLLPKRWRDLLLGGLLVATALMFSGFAFVGKKPAPRPATRQARQGLTAPT